MARAYTAKTGSISYNGFDFPGPLHTDIVSEPVYSSNGVFVKYNRITIQISGSLNVEDGGGSLDSYVEGIRKKLSVNGGTFSMSGFGYGDLSSNYSNNPELGPRPGPLKIRPLADNITLLFEWSIVVAITNCPLYDNGPIGEVAYSINWNVNDNGTYSREISGRLEVHPQGMAFNKDTGINFQNIQHNAEARIRTVLDKFPRIERMRRKHSYSVSEDRKWLNFQIMDEEIDSDLPFPPGIADLSIIRTISSIPVQGASAQATVNPGLQAQSIGGHVEYLQGIGKAAAWELVQDVIAKVILGKKAKIVLVVSYSLSTDLYKRRIDFQLDTIISAELSKLLADSELFVRPNVTHNWGDYSKSLNDIIGYRGINGKAPEPGKELFITYCTSDSGPPDSVSPGDSTDPSSSIGKLPKEEDNGQGYLIYYNHITVFRETDSSMMTYSRNIEVTEKQLTYNENTGPTTGENVSSSEPSAVVWDRGSSRLLLSLQGHATRVGKKPHIPRLTGHPGIKTKEEKITGPAVWGQDGSGQDLWSADWERIYYLPTTISLPETTTTNDRPGQDITI